MQRFFSFYDFLNEEEIPLTPELEEFTVQNKGDGKFSFELDSAPIHFDVLPVPYDVKPYQTILDELTVAIQKDIPSGLYEVLSKLENLPYKFGNVIPASLSLENVPSLSLSLTDTQRGFLKDPARFLRTQYPTLSKELKIEIISYLKKQAQLYAIVLESMFYYLRSQKTSTSHEN